MKIPERVLRIAKLLLKIAVTTLAFWYIFSKIDFAEVIQTLGKTHWPWLVPAFFFFTASKVIAAFRLNYFFRDQGVDLSEKKNLFLYWLGMFYNLFLPGGIGGDGYKAYWLNRHKAAKVKPTVFSLLLDRVCGLVALLVIAMVLFVFLPGIPEFDQFKPLAWLGILLAYPVYYFVLNRFFKQYVKSWIPTSVLGMAVQLSQVIGTYFILLAMGLGENWLVYELIFLASSIVSVLPITIGGLGSRELVFFVFANHFNLEADLSVSVSLWVYLISLGNSFLGVYFLLFPKVLEEPQPDKTLS